MKELLRTNDHVLLSFATALLAEHHIVAVVLDSHTSIALQRLGQAHRHHIRARRLLAEGGVPLRRV